MMRRVVALVLVAACGGGEANGPPDAPVSECGLPLPGSRCTTGTVLERCNGKNREQIDCATSGMLCGTDPASVDKAACVAWGQSCGLVSGAGACNGDVLTRCNRNGQLRIIDCGERGARCAFQTASQRNECTDACRDVGVDAEGQCTANLQGITRCVYKDGVYAVETDGCPSGSFCRDPSADTFSPSCSPLCSGIALTGRCAGDMVMRCDGAQIVTTDCAASGKVCAWSDSDGYACALPGKVGSRVVSGRITYEDRAPADGLLGQPTPLPARGAVVALIADADGRAVATATANDLGDYTLRYDAAVGSKLRILAVSASFTAARPVRVLRPDALLHSFASPPFDVADATTIDLVVTERSGVAEAFNILDVMVTGQDMVRNRIGIASPRQVAVVWGMNSSTGTFTVQSGTIYLLGGLDLSNHTVDDDGYDDAVMAHEFGHVIEFGYGATSNPGLAHAPFEPLAPTLAWSEGFADWTSSALRGDPAYVDTNGLGGFAFELDTTVTSANPALPMTQMISENTVAEILWDLSDAPAVDDDPVAGMPDDVFRVERNYLGGHPSDRGATGIDFVDFLDGYFIVNGAGNCAGARTVVASRGFPYDFAGPTPCN